MGHFCGTINSDESCFANPQVAEVVKRRFTAVCLIAMAVVVDALNKRLGWAVELQVFGSASFGMVLKGLLWCAIALSR